MHRSLIIILILLALGLSGCNTSNSLDPPMSETPSPEPVTASPTPFAVTHTPILSPTPQPTPTPHTPQTSRYLLEAVLDYDLHQLQVNETIQYVNPSTETLNDLVLMVDTLYYPGTFQLKSLTWENGSPIEGYQVETGLIRFVLREPLPGGEKLELHIDYQLNLPSPQPSPTTRPVPFGHTERQTNLVDWYPFVPPYQEGRGWIAHPASYYGEHLVYEIADFEVKIRLANPRADYVIAASAPAILDGDGFRYEHQSARNFVWSVSPYYQVIQGQVGETTVYSYAFPAQDQANQAVLKTTMEAIELYSKLFGPYPKKTLSVVEADFLDGMEYDGLYFLSKGFYNLYTGDPGEYLVAIAAHETSHQWWYGLLGNDQAIEPWLDEALATYSERLYYENYYPETLDWWWTYRIYYYEPRGYVDDSIYNPHGEIQAYRAYRDAVYLNGAVFLEELRKTIGDQAFFTFLGDYTRQNRNQIVMRKTFFSLLDQYTEQDLTDLVAKYFYYP